MRTTKFSLNNQIIDATNKDSGNWRQLLTSAGIAYVTIAGSGIFLNGKAEKILTQKAFANEHAEYEISFANKDVLKGTFHLTSYDRTCNFNEEEGYNIILESSGRVEYG